MEIINVFESVEVDTSRWSFSSGKRQPSGLGFWFFKIGDEEKSWNMRYSDAKKEAQKYAKSKGITHITLMEGTEQRKLYSIDEDDWITIKGTHVLIDDKKKIKSGPKALKDLDNKK